MATIKQLYWVGSSKKELLAFPDEVRKEIGYALHLAQTSEKAKSAKPLKGFGGAGVMEVVEDYDGDTYRAIYTVRFADAVYVLHAFQKKAKRGIKTPQHEIKLIEERLKWAQQDSKGE